MHRILVIEDDFAISSMYEFKLKNEGHEVRCAHNGIMGLKQCEQFSPDLVLLDLHLPDINGDKVLKQIRESDWGTDIRVIVLTNMSKQEAPHSLRFLNVDRYIVKAHQTPSQVLNTVKSVLIEARQQI